MFWNRLCDLFLLILIILFNKYLCITRKKKEIEIALIIITNWGKKTIIIQRKLSLRRVTRRSFLTRANIAAGTVLLNCCSSVILDTVGLSRFKQIKLFAAE